MGGTSTTRIGLGDIVEKTMDKASELLFRTAEPFAMACAVVCELELENERLRAVIEAIKKWDIDVAASNFAAGSRVSLRLPIELRGMIQEVMMRNSEERANT